MKWWAERYLKAAKLNQDVRTCDKSGAKEEFVISDVVSVEETVWSPVWGIKGMIDATVLTKFSSSSSQDEKSWILPLELKTGQHGDVAAVSHRAQVQLYSLLLRDRYGNDREMNDEVMIPDSSHESEAGVLLYVRRKYSNRTQGLERNKQTQVHGSQSKKTKIRREE